MENYVGVNQVIEVRADIDGDLTRVLSRNLRIKEYSSAIGEEILKQLKEYYDPIGIKYIGRMRILCKDDNLYKVLFYRADNIWKPVAMSITTEDIATWTVEQITSRKLHLGDFYETKKLKLQQNGDVNKDLTKR